MHLDKQIFMGNGEHSMARCHYAHRLLEEAFEILNGIQQPPRPGCDPPEAFDQHELDVENGEMRLQQIANELYLAITGKRIITKETATND